MSSYFKDASSCVSAKKRRLYCFNGKKGGFVLLRKYRHLIYNGQYQFEALKNSVLSENEFARQLDSDRAISSCSRYALNAVRTGVDFRMEVW